MKTTTAKGFDLGQFQKKYIEYTKECDYTKKERLFLYNKHKMTVEDVKSVAEYAIKKRYSVYDIFVYFGGDLLKEAGVGYFKYLMYFTVRQNHAVYFALRYCQDLLKEAGVEYFMKIVRLITKDEKDLKIVFEYCQDLLRQAGKEYFKEIVEFMIDHEYGLDCLEYCKKLPFYNEVIKELNIELIIS
jgi:hypothetical protein